MLVIEICGWELQSTVIGHHIVLYIGTSILEMCRHVSTASSIVMITIGVHLIEIKKCSHQDMVIKLGIRARLYWERVKQNNVKSEDNPLAG